MPQTTPPPIVRSRITLADGPRRGITVWPRPGADLVEIKVFSTVHVYEIRGERAYHLFDRDARD